MCNTSMNRVPTTRPKERRMNKTRLAALATALMLAGCANLNLFPAFERPALEAPQAWPGLPAHAVAFDHAQWWTLYGDATLNQLIEEALAHNEDIAVATARIDEATAQLTLADVEREPTLTGTFTPSYTRSTQRGTNPLPPTFSAKSRDYAVRINATYELDLWGKLRGASAAARAELLASEAARDTVRNTLTAQLAQGYFALLALDAQIATTRRTQETRLASLKLQQLRMQGGVSSEFEVRQVEADLAAVQAQIPALERQRTQQQNALAVLLGRSPRDLVEGSIARGAPAALAAQQSAREVLAAERAHVEALQKALVLAKLRYDNGISSQLEVLDAERNLLQAELNLTAAEQAQRAAIADLFKAMGGGWNKEAKTAPG
ncbi:MAG: hypothetical protein D4R48_01545 [Nitrosomonadales bacterium]|nr:MAG: hypothetical protein D4R48_01545 [Nitrosomonadales bacterium]